MLKCFSKVRRRSGVAESMALYKFWISWDERCSQKVGLGAALRERLLRGRNFLHRKTMSGEKLPMRDVSTAKLFGRNDVDVMGQANSGPGPCDAVHVT